MPGWQKVDGSLTASRIRGEVSTHSCLGHGGFCGVRLLRLNWKVLQIAEQLLEAKTDAFDWSAVQELRAVLWTQAAAFENFRFDWRRIQWLQIESELDLTKLR